MLYINVLISSPQSDSDDDEPTKKKQVQVRTFLTGKYCIIKSFSVPLSGNWLLNKKDTKICIYI